MASGLISTDELARWLHQKQPVTVLDVRGKGSYLQGHIGGSVVTRWQDFTDGGPIKGILHPDSAVLAERFSALGITNETPVVLVSEPFENWGAEGRFFWMLHYLGHGDIRVLDGGYPKWKREGKPIALLPSRASKGQFTPLLRMDTAIDLEGVEACLNNDPDTVIVDTRGSDEYAEEGHIPGAVNLPWVSLYGDDGTLKPPDELRGLLAQVGIIPDRRIVPYCTGGVRSAWLFFVLYLLGYERVQNYDGSWWEWTDDPARPVER